MLADVLTHGFLLLLGFLMVLDLVWSARQFPKVRNWRVKGATATATMLGLGMLLPPLWDDWLGAHRLLDLSSLGTLGGALVGLLAYQFCGYWWHRALHSVPFLWRFHQMHHSAERVDIYGANWFHPLDMVGWTFLPSFALVMVFGVTGEAAVIAVILSNAVAILGHANLRTPRWLGYVIQRPENHAMHHLRDAHAGNYGDFSLWDQVFGTWINPERFEGVGGYYDGASSRIGQMLLMRDVTQAPATAANQSGSYTQYVPVRTRRAS